MRYFITKCSSVLIITYVQPFPMSLTQIRVFSPYNNYLSMHSSIYPFYCLPACNYVLSYRDTYVNSINFLHVTLHTMADHYRHFEEIHILLLHGNILHGIAF